MQLLALQIVPYSVYNSKYTFLTDIDECKEEADICALGTCSNTEGSFACLCPEGFIVSTTGRRCQGKSLSLFHVEDAKFMLSTVNYSGRFLMRLHKHLWYQLLP